MHLYSRFASRLFGFNPGGDDRGTYCPRVAPCDMSCCTICDNGKIGRPKRPLAPLKFWALVLGLFGCALFIAHGWWSYSKALEIVKTRAILTTYAIACSNYHAHFGRWPTALEELVHNASNICFVSIDSPGTDAWGHELIYINPGDSNSFGLIRSFGADGQPGGRRRNADLEVYFWRPRAQ